VKGTLSELWGLKKLKKNNWRKRGTEIQNQPQRGMGNSSNRAKPSRGNEKTRKGNHQSVKNPTNQNVIGANQKKKEGKGKSEHDQTRTLKNKKKKWITRTIPKHQVRKHRGANSKRNQSRDFRGGGGKWFCNIGDNS